MNKAGRRQQIQRMKAKRAIHYGAHNGTDLRSDPKQLGKAVTTPCACSCWMCGNPRKYGEVSLKERLAKIEYEETR